MNISIIGTGYVGLVTGACLANTHDVICLDIDKDKIKRLKHGEMPIYEEGLEEIVKENVSAGRLKFTSKYDDIGDTEVVFCCVGTPMKADGSADLSYVMRAAKETATHMRRDFIWVDKSTVPIGTADDVFICMSSNISDGVDFDVCSNPEFLKEGTAVQDFMHPDRIVIGASSEHAFETMDAVYEGFSCPILHMDTASAETTKYAANAMLATRISFMNEIANLCDATGANVDDVANAIGRDPRIGPKFLKAGCGYGGSCFPKDVKALIKTAESHGIGMHVLEAVDETNERQKHMLFDKMLQAGIIGIRKAAVLGLTFKPNTDDLREAPSLVLIRDLLANTEAQINIYDPIASDKVVSMLEEDRIHAFNSMQLAMVDVDVAFVVTEWDEIRKMDVACISVMHEKTVIDGRNCLDPKSLGDNVRYIGFGK